MNEQECGGEKQLRHQKDHGNVTAFPACPAAGVHNDRHPIEHDAVCRYEQHGASGDDCCYLHGMRNLEEMGSLQNSECPAGVAPILGNFLPDWLGSSLRRTMPARS